MQTREEDPSQGKQTLAANISSKDSADGRPGCQHQHGSGHHDHAAHADLDSADGRQRVLIVCAMTAFFTVVEAVGGIVSGSLALLADAAHMLADTASLALARIGYWFANKPPDDTRPFGFGRMRVLAAFTNGILLLGLAIWILVEGMLRLLNPQPVIGSLMLGIAFTGLVVNLVAVYILHRGDVNDINLSGALWHVIGDLMGSLAAIVAALIIMGTDWIAVDPLLSMLVAALVLVAGVRITYRAGHILVQGAPDDLTPSIMRTALIEQVAGVIDVNEARVWLLTEDKSIATLCVTAEEGYSIEALRSNVKFFLTSTFHVHFVTVEIASSQHHQDPNAVRDLKDHDSGFRSRGDAQS